MNQENLSKLKINYWFLMIIFGLMAVGGVVAIIFFLRTSSLADKKIAEAAETKRPANLELVTITDNSCTDCFDLKTVFDYIKKQNANITSEKKVDKTSAEAKQLIEQFAIKKLPTFILKGELNKISTLSDFFSKTGDTDNDTFVFRQVGAPYVAADTGVVKGRVTFTLITDPTCTDCYDASQHQLILQSYGINAVPNVVDAKSSIGKSLIKKYKINAVPTFVLSGDVAQYPGLGSIWDKVGIVASDGTYVFTNMSVMGRYRNLSTNQVITPPVPTSTQQ
jgi:thiol-disulfide isomerase/thioredoxin